MLRKLERLIKIDSYLRERGRKTASVLAHSLEVSERTIRSDLDFMKDRFNAPIDYDNGQGWHYTDSAWRLPNIPLTEGEIFALMLSASIMQSFTGSTYEAELRSSIKRLSKRLPEKSFVDLQKLANEKVIFRIGAHVIDLNPQIWKELTHAQENLQRVRIEYYTASRNQVTQRIVDPYLIYYQATNPYLIGFCHVRGEIRWFRIDRIQKLEILDEFFVLNPNFVATTYLQEIFQAEVGERVHQIIIWFDPSTAPFVRNRKWHSSQEIEEHVDGSMTLIFSTTGLNEIKRWILSYGKGAMVKSPPELVALFKAEVEQLHQNYSQ